MTHDEIVAKAEELGLDTEDQTDEEMLMAIGQAEADDKQAVEDAEAAKVAAEAQQLEDERIAHERAEVAAKEKVAKEEAAAKAQAARDAASKAARDAEGSVQGSAQSGATPPPTRLYTVKSAFDFVDPMTNKMRRAQNGTNIRLTAAQAKKFTRHRNAVLVA